MGTYNLSADEIEQEFLDFLKSQEGEVHKDTLIEVWNRLSKKFGWREEIKDKKVERRYKKMNIRYNER